MAYDKVVDSSVLDAGLTQIANAIREKGGTSASLAFPGGMTAAIAAIATGESGGGLPDGITEINTGSFTLASDFKGVYNITHGLSRTPNFHIVYAEYDDAKSIGENYLLLDFGMAIKSGYGAYWSQQNVYASDYDTIMTWYNWCTNPTNQKIPIDCQSDSKLKSGITYHWIAGVADGMA